LLSNQVHKKKVSPSKLNSHVRLGVRGKEVGGGKLKRKGGKGGGGTPQQKKEPSSRKSQLYARGARGPLTKQKTRKGKKSRIK